jgi:hypothetical protein
MKKFLKKLVKFGAEASGTELNRIINKEGCIPISSAIFYTIGGILTFLFLVMTVPLFAIGLKIYESLPAGPKLKLAEPVSKKQKNPFSF